jgi:hypothetical protein
VIASSGELTALLGEQLQDASHFRDDSADRHISDLAHPAAGALSDQFASYPAAVKSFSHPLGEKRSMMRPVAGHRASTARSAALRSRALSLAKAFSRWD